MKILKFVLIGLVSIIALALIAALFIDQDITIKKEITINKPKADVFAYLKLLKNQDNYSVWARMDPNQKKEFRGEDGTVGFVSAWNGEVSGVGEQEIKKIAEGERMDFELRFKKPFESTDYAYMTTESVSDSATKVVWGFEAKMEYPKNLMIPLMDMNKMLGDQLQTGLDTLKFVVEKQ